VEEEPEYIDGELGEHLDEDMIQATHDNDDQYYGPLEADLRWRRLRRGGK
jgi:hypothetical protein